MPRNIRIIIIIITGTALGGAVARMLLMHRGVIDVLTGVFVAGTAALAADRAAGQARKWIAKREAEHERREAEHERREQMLILALDRLSNTPTRPQPALRAVPSPRRR